MVAPGRNTRSFPLPPRDKHEKMRPQHRYRRGRYGSNNFIGWLKQIIFQRNGWKALGWAAVAIVACIATAWLLGAFDVTIECNGVAASKRSTCLKFRGMGFRMSQRYGYMSRTTAASHSTSSQLVLLVAGDSSRQQLNQRNYLYNRAVSLLKRDGFAVHSIAVVGKEAMAMGHDATAVDQTTEIVSMADVDGLNMQSAISMTVWRAILGLVRHKLAEKEPIAAILCLDNGGIGHIALQSGLIDWSSGTAQDSGLNLPPILVVGSPSRWWIQSAGLQPVERDDVEAEGLARSATALADGVLFMDSASYRWSKLYHGIGTCGGASSSVSVCWGGAEWQEEQVLGSGGAGDEQATTLANGQSTTMERVPFTSWRRRIPAGMWPHLTREVSARHGRNRAAPPSASRASIPPTRSLSLGTGHTIRQRSTQGFVHVYIGDTSVISGFPALVSALARLPLRLAREWRAGRSIGGGALLPGGGTGGAAVRVACIVPLASIQQQLQQLGDALRAGSRAWSVPRTTAELEAIMGGAGAQEGTSNFGNDLSSRWSVILGPQRGWDWMGSGPLEHAVEVRLISLRRSGQEVSVPVLRVALTPANGWSHAEHLATGIVQNSLSAGMEAVFLQLGRGQAGPAPAEDFARQLQVGSLQQLPAVRPQMPFSIPRGGAGCLVENKGGHYDTTEMGEYSAPEHLVVPPYPDSLADAMFLAPLIRSQNGNTGAPSRSDRYPTCHSSGHLDQPDVTTFRQILSAAQQAKAAQQCRLSTRTCLAKGACGARTGSPPPVLSVVMAHYERPVLLQQALEALSRQTFQDFEVIVVDDSSQSDAAAKALSDLEESYLMPRGWRLIRREQGMYLGSLRNVGIEAARGEYLFFVDDDDIGLPNELELLLCALGTGKADVVSSYVSYFDTQDVPQRWKTPVSSMEELLGIYANFGFVGVGVGLGVRDNVFGPSRFMVRASVVRAAGPYHEEWGVGREDHEYLARLSLMGATVVVLPVPLFAKRGSGGSGAPTMTHTMGRLHANQVALRPYIAAIAGDTARLEINGWDDGASEGNVPAMRRFPAAGQLEAWMHWIQASL